MGLTTTPRKKVPVRKPEMWPRKGLMKRMQPNWKEQSRDRWIWRRSIMEEVHYGGPALGCSANEERNTLIGQY